LFSRRLTPTGREAAALHLEAMREVGEPIPEPATDIDFVELDPAV
jgi:hypothetical protein